ncbi:MAG: hypothetical protein KC897_11930 [Candidatus Omnitrophica bacterium]|nr:hypothetical protein [Candidatus Omnitrophota bacterium]MCB9720224.1 hypothetical protein [Candidatus Omnitrophota bacterium]
MKSTTLLLIILILTLSVAGAARAESISCPAMGIPIQPADPRVPSGKVFADANKDTLSGYANCEYGPKTRILVSWFSSLNREMWQDKCAERRSLANDIDVKFNNKKKWVIVTSRSHLTLVYMWLSPKEYRNRRDDWAAAGRKLLQEHVSRGMSCADYDPGTAVRSVSPTPAVPSRPSEPPAAPQRYAPTQQGRDPNPSQPMVTPKAASQTPEPVVQPDDVDEKIDDILERLKGSD